MTYLLSEQMYKTKDPDLVFTFEGEIFPEKKKHIVSVQGDNGVGKTIFLEKVFIPILRKERKPYFFLAQDFELQSYCVRSSLAVFKKKLPVGNFYEVVKSFIESVESAKETSSNLIAIFDEFDKRCNDDQLVSLFARDSISYLVIVTHDPIRVHEEAKKVFNSGSSLNFEKDSQKSERRLGTECSQW
jgi:archaellum biogenesis ATPase FlaH